MDYGKSGNAAADKNTPKHSEAKAKGAAKVPQTEAAKKQALLARMKAAAQKPE
ncbi:MAG: hypothetical protein V4712_16790 [Pseudomonadota bacterium]